MIEDVARDRAEAAAETGGLSRRQCLSGNGDNKMFEQRLAQRRYFIIAKRLGEIEAMDFRAERGAGGLDAKCHVHSAITSAASR